VSLSLDDTNLGMLLPMRSGQSTVEYQKAVLSEFPARILDHISERLCRVSASDAMLFSSDVTEDGQHFLFQGCDQDGLVFSPKHPILSPEHYENTLIFMEIEQYIWTFFARLKYLFEGNLHFDMPQVLYRRQTRHNKRVRIDGNVIVGRSDGSTSISRIYDFSPTGMSFLTEETGFMVGESLFVSFEIPSCGSCETIATVVRIENHPAGRGFNTLVAVKMALTNAQKIKAEHLYLCRKAEEIKKRSGFSRTLRPGEFYIKD
jgi:hypothetical protein